jgi:hypothetical protein
MPGPVVGASGHVVDPSFATLGFHLLGSKLHAHVQNFLQLSTSVQSFPDGGTVAMHALAEPGAWACESPSAAMPTARLTTASAKRPFDMAISGPPLSEVQLIHGD